VDFGSIIRSSAHDHRDRVAVWCDGRTQTYAELFERSCRLANALAALGLEKGDRVGTLGANGFETVEQVCGIALGGLVRASLYTHQAAEVNAYPLGLVDARVLIVHASLLDGVRAELGAVASLEHVVVYGGPAPAGTLAYEDLLAAAPADAAHTPSAGRGVRDRRPAREVGGDPEGGRRSAARCARSTGRRASRLGPAPARRACSRRCP
jgi:acyl-CoA synthetase (AMP-forming)/AMP-acid ligase II